MEWCSRRRRKRSLHTEEAEEIAAILKEVGSTVALELKKKTRGNFHLDSEIARTLGLPIFSVKSVNISQRKASDDPIRALDIFHKEWIDVWRIPGNVVLATRFFGSRGTTDD